MSQGRSFPVCVFCGSRPGRSPAFEAAAVEVGQGLAAAGMELVYGGGDVGLMGVCARAANEAGGRVTGFIPRRLLEREAGKRDITELVVTETMSDRKFRMIERSKAFVTLPGGLGTLDELLEVLTLRQLGYHDGAILLVDVEGYWRPYMAMHEDVVRQGFADTSAMNLLEVVPDAAATLRRLKELAG